MCTVSWNAKGIYKGYKPCGTTINSLTYLQTFQKPEKQIWRVWPQHTCFFFHCNNRHPNCSRQTFVKLATDDLRDVCETRKTCEMRHVCTNICKAGYKRFSRRLWVARRSWDAKNMQDATHVYGLFHIFMQLHKTNLLCLEPSRGRNGNYARDKEIFSWDKGWNNCMRK